MFHYLIPPLTKNWDNFLCIGPFSMFLDALKSHGHAAHYAFNFIKKYSFFEKLEPKTFCDIFFITRFSKNIFSKNNFEKSKILVFQKITFSRKIWLFIEKSYFSRKSDFLKNQNFRCFKNIFRKNIFRKSSYEKNVTKSFRL